MVTLLKPYRFSGHVLKGDPLYDTVDPIPGEKIKPTSFPVYRPDNQVLYYVNQYSPTVRGT